jgi:hypothetical protein
MTAVIKFLKECQDVTEISAHKFKASRHYHQPGQGSPSECGFICGGFDLRNPRGAGDFHRGPSAGR